jgi:hypothetical protein
MSNFSQRQDHQHVKTKKGFFKAKVDALKVINDTAERAIGFVAKHNSDPRTTNEETFQEILQSAENHYRRVPNVNKELSLNTNRFEFVIFICIHLRHSCLTHSANAHTSPRVASSKERPNV